MMSDSCQPVPTPISDDEIVADMFRLAKTGLFREVESLLVAAQEMYPGETVDRLKSCRDKLANRLWETNHGGYRDEYVRQRRPKRRA